MASVTLYCPSVKMWNNDDDYWENYGYTISGSYKAKPLNSVSPTILRLGLQRMEFDALPKGTITSAILHFQSFNLQSTPESKTVYFRASDNADAWHTTEPPSPVSKSVTFTTTRTDYTLDITDQVNDYGTAGAALYLYAFLSGQVSYVSVSNVWHYSGYMPYIEITYTPAPENSIIGLYDAATASWKNCNCYKYDAATASWVLCSCYKYDAASATWKKVSTT